ncbi:MAG: bifunctional [glutamine synthetase] adenylyltransferase/[glutamine synthetase]-adenylyl-L-tyrosine phosphorylase [Sphingobium sp.]
MSEWSETLARARAHAPFLSLMMDRLPNISALLANGQVDDAWAAARASGAHATTPMQSLRWERNAVALVTACADLAGVWSLEQVTHALSDFADDAVETALVAAFAERYPNQEMRGFAVLALGKHGSRELNYSSDIDPILLFDPETLPRRAQEEPVEAAVRLARRMTEILSARDGDGYVFRVDLRLRPSPEASPLALPVEAAIGYYESVAMGWEQAAFIRARVCAGDRAVGEYFLRSIRPFIWRRSLDFGAIDAITDISRRIRDHYASGQMFGPGYDLKRGRGGIREVEFFAQAHQLIHGGRNPDLRGGATRDALAALGGAGIIPSDVATQLDQAYVLFRTIEHRLQMVDDLQTHTLPASSTALDNVARLHGVNDGQALLDLLRPHVEWVGRNFDQLSPPDAQERLSINNSLLRDQIVALGFPDTDVAVSRIGNWREGSVRALRNASARDALELLLPGLIGALARAPDPVTALNRLDNMISRLPSAINFFKLLVARPAVVNLLCEILSHAPILADELSRRADLLDGLIDASALDPVPALDMLVHWLSAGENGDDFQTLLDRVRQKVGDRRFAVGTQIICGTGDLIEAGAGYGRLAEAAVRVLGQAAVTEFEKIHGRIEGGELVILALGRLGGGVLTHASDLDVVYLFTGDFAQESDGPKPLGATQYFNRLAQRVSNALSVSTASGPLYEVDTRLRPFGAQGLLAVSVTSFAQYQAESAWVWEHLALTRARTIFGSDIAQAQVADIISQTLRRSRDLRVLIRDAVKMRGDITRHKGNAGPLDVKLGSGGLVDLEFLTHVTQFRVQMGFVPDIAAAIAALVEAGHLPPAILAAHNLLTRYLIISRLVSPSAAQPPPATQGLVARRCNYPDWLSLVAAMDEARHSVATAWAAIIETSEEPE